MVLLNEFKAWPSSRQSLGQVPAEQPPGRALEQGGANSREEQRNPRRQICLENSSVSICWVRSCYRNWDDRGRAISWACVCVRREGASREELLKFEHIMCVLVESCKECRNYSLAQPVELQRDIAVVPCAQQALAEAGRLLPA